MVVAYSTYDGETRTVTGSFSERDSSHVLPDTCRLEVISKERRLLSQLFG